MSDERKQHIEVLKELRGDVNPEGADPYGHMMAAALDAAIAALGGGWLPIESTPADGRVVLFCDEHGNRWTDCSHPEPPYMECGYPAAYWMPRPSPPLPVPPSKEGVRMARDRKCYREDPPADSWPWERARRAVASVLRRCYWRVSNPTADEIEAIGRQAKNNSTTKDSHDPDR